MSDILPETGGFWLTLATLCSLPGRSDRWHTSSLLLEVTSRLNPPARLEGYPSIRFRLTKEPLRLLEDCGLTACSH